jgi:YHS domain-containing protein
MRKLRGLLVLALIIVASVTVVSAAAEKCVVTGRECDGSISATVEGDTYYFSSKGAKRLFELRPEKYVNKVKGIKTCPVTGAKGYACPSKKLATCPSTKGATCPSTAKKATCDKGCNCSSKVKDCSSSCTTCPSKKACPSVKKTTCEKGCNCSSGKVIKSEVKKQTKKYSFKEESLSSVPSDCPTDTSQCGDCTGCDK